MKRCPRCNQFFNSDDVFCLNDGSMLEVVGSASNETPTQVLSSPFTGAAAKTTGGNRFYWIIGLMALMIVFLLGGVFFLLLKPAPARTSETIDNKPGNSQISVSGPKSENDTSSMSAPAAVPNQPALPPVTTEAVKDLLKRWEQAQDAQNFRSYQDCYGQPFLGFKRTKSGSVSRMNYTQWMNDRRKMISKAIGLDVEIEGLQIAIEGDTAMAEFEQYYRSVSYSDRGPKVLKVKMFSDGAKIVYEDLKASYPLN